MSEQPEEHEVTDGTVADAVPDHDDEVVIDPSEIGEDEIGVPDDDTD